MAPESRLGLYMSLVFASCAFFVYCELRANSSTGFLSHFTRPNDGFTGPNGYRSMQDRKSQTGLLAALAAFSGIGFLLWTRLVWFQEDPGIVDTRYNDFDDVRNVPFVRQRL